MFIKHWGRVLSSYIVFAGLLLFFGSYGCKKEVEEVKHTVLETEYAAEVVSVNPSPGATDVPINTSIQIRFSTEMDKDSTLSATKFTSESGDPVLGYIEWGSDNKTLVLHPMDPLSYSTRFYVYISSVARTIDKSGKLKPFYSDFITANRPDEKDTTPPSVVSTYPSNGASDVSQRITIYVNFSEPMDTLATESAFKVYKLPENTFVDGFKSWNSDNTQINFSPASQLEGNTTYKVVITNGAKDLSGNTMTSSYEFTFTTVSDSYVDTTPPSISSTSPENNDSGVSLDSNIVVVFSEPMDTASVESAFGMINKEDDSSVYGSFSWEDGDTKLIFNPNENLNFKYSDDVNNGKYCVTIGSTAKDKNGVEMGSDYAFCFYSEDIRDPDTKDRYARKYAPELHLTKYGEDGDDAGLDWTRPANVGWYLNTGHYDGGDLIGASLRFNHDGCPDCVVASVGDVTLDNLPTFSHREKTGIICTHNDTIRYSNEVYSGDDLTEARFFLQPRKGGGEGEDYDKMHHGIYGGPNGDNPSLFDKDGAGEYYSDLISKGVYPDRAPDVGKWVMYVHFLEDSDPLGKSRYTDLGGFIDIQYWFFYTYNDSIGSFNHESDWEHITVSISRKGEPVAVFMSEHEGGTLFTKDSSCESGFRSSVNMKYNGNEERVCMLVTFEDGGFHPIGYSADGSHAVYPLGPSVGTYTWDGYAGGLDDYTTKDGPVWKGWLVSGSLKNYEVVENTTPWIRYAGLWGEVGTNSVTTGKRGPKYQGWGCHLEKGDACP